MKKVFYVGYYDVLRDGRRVRSYSLAAAKKMDFICDALETLGMDVEIVSPAYSIEPGVRHTQGGEQIGENRRLTLPVSWYSKLKPLRLARTVYVRLWLFAYLVRHCSKDSDVLVYHNYETALPVLLARRVRGFNLIAQIEEQYSMVWKLNRWQKWKEDLFFRSAKDGSLVVSEVLADRLGVKDPIVSYGNYGACRSAVPEGRGDGKIRLVYTGGIEQVRNGAYLSLETMRYLPENYELKLSGPIAKGEEAQFMAALEAVNRSLGRKACEYMGLLDDSAYEALLLGADMALNPQQGGGFGGFLFPSKILTYMSHGLTVVSTPGESIVQSRIADLIAFAEEFTPQSVAEAVLSAKIRPRGEYIERLNRLNEDFLNKLSRRISGR